MADDVAKTLARAGAQLLPSPLKALATAIGGLLGRPDLGDAAVSALQEDVVRLHRQVIDAVAGLDADVKAKTDPVEVVELTMQTVSNMGRTAYADKRVLMAKVLLYGIEHPDVGTTERRLFVRAVADLDIA